MHAVAVLWATRPTIQAQLLHTENSLLRTSYYVLLRAGSTGTRRPGLMACFGSLLSTSILRSTEYTC
jgi:hypothetical protein